MCTLIALVGLPGLPPVVLAANRDELLARPTAPTAVFEVEGKKLVGGRDLEAGGSWFAVGPHCAAALTNDRSRGDMRRGSVSRGGLVTRAAAAPSPSAVGKVLAEDRGDYGPFHMLVLADDEAIYATNTTGALKVSTLAPGVHVLGNFALNDQLDPIVRNLSGDIDAFLNTEPTVTALLAHLRALLMRHGPGWPCLHMGIYGTRYSSLLVTGDSPRLEISERASCQVGLSDHTRLLREVRP